MPPGALGLYKIAGSLYSDTREEVSRFPWWGSVGLWDNRRCSGGSRPRCRPPGVQRICAGANEVARTPDEDPTTCLRTDSLPPFERDSWADFAGVGRTAGAGELYPDGPLVQHRGWLCRGQTGAQLDRPGGGVPLGRDAAVDRRGGVLPSFGAGAVGFVLDALASCWLATGEECWAGYVGGFLSGCDRVAAGESAVAWGAAGCGHDGAPAGRHDGALPESSGCFDRAGADGGDVAVPGNDLYVQHRSRMGDDALWLPGADVGALVAVAREPTRSRG